MRPSRPPTLRRARRALFVIVLVAQMSFLLGGVAAAYWQATGSGTGTTPTAVTAPVTVEPGTPAATLYPGGHASVVLVMSNPNVSPAHIAALALDPSRGSAGFTVDPAHSGCGLSALSFTTQTNGGARWIVPGRTGSANGTLSVDLANALALGAGAANACQGATFMVFLMAAS